MPEIMLELAQLALKNGALGIGEDHGDPAGRQLALDLINMGLVRHFFTELYEEEGNLEKLGKASRAAASGDSLLVVESLAPSGHTLGNSIKQGRVIARALQRGAQVHLADIQKMKYRPTFHAPRHSNIRAKYRIVTNQPAPGAASAVGENCRGCLLLWGAAHFEGDTSLDIFLPGLQFVKLG